MLFDDVKKAAKAEARPRLPKATVIDYKIGFLLNFASPKSTRFDLEPILIYEKGKSREFKRISMQVSKGLAYLQPLPDDFYNDLLQFTDSKIIQWMTNKGVRWIRNSNTGSWAHTSSRDLVNLRRHYRNILSPLWPRLCAWPDVFYLQAGRFEQGRVETAKLSNEPVSFSFAVQQVSDTIRVKLVARVNNKEVNPKLVGGCLFEINNTLHLPSDSQALQLFDTFKNGPLIFSLADKQLVFLQQVIPYLDTYPIEIDRKLNVVIAETEFKAHVRLSELNESNLMIRPEFVYDQETLEYGNERYHIQVKDDLMIIIKRNKEEEKVVYEYLRTLHQMFSNQRNNQYYYLTFDDVMKKGWFLTMMRQVQEQGYSIQGLSSLKKFRYSTHTPEFIIDARTTPECFELKVTIRWGDQQVSLKEIRHAILNHQHTLMLEDGTLGHIPEEWVSQYSLLLRTGKEENGILKISKLHYTLLEDIIDQLDKEGQREVVSRKEKLLSYDTLPKAPVSAAIQATLRPYQQSGLHWLQALDELGWGGCLADDMGLGKTLQTISFLQYVKEKYPGSTQLVICPTSLIFNWENEIQKFCPSLKFFTHYGSQRDLDETIFETHDVVLTTYGVVRNDLDMLSGYLWQYVILDESQAIKNPDAQITKTLLKLRSVNRVILSGTPVQNNTFDLFAQFNFLNPGLLGTREFFNREFATPIDKFGSKEKTVHLKKLIHPFTLRRTKEQVADDLPDKTVTVLWCTMDAAQRKVYDDFRLGFKKSLLRKIDEQGIAKSGLDVLEGLLRLRQICDHPALVMKGDENHSSVKIDELIREVKENAAQHKLLIFSQFTEMLHLIRNEFDASGVSYCYLDGSTSLAKRKTQVETFQEDASIKAFLISIKAGGVGLNLTVADYVYIVDPWWNPAAEQQAIDRAHRIGQKRKVFAYKMICKDTVEEKILQLQQRKKMLADDLIQEDAGFVKTLSRDDVEFLFG